MAFLELKNVGATPVDLVGFRFLSGIDFTFTSASGVTILAPGERLLVVKNQAAFTSRYGTGINILGQYTDSLDNNGEEIRLLDASNNIIQDFAYSDSWYPTTDGDGYTPQAIQVLTLDGVRIAQLHGFVRPDLFSVFDLPLRLSELCDGRLDHRA